MRVGMDLNTSASKRIAFTAVFGKLFGSKTNSVIEVNSKASITLVSVLSAVTLVTVTVTGKSEVWIFSGKNIIWSLKYGDVLFPVIVPPPVCISRSSPVKLELVLIFLVMY